MQKFLLGATASALVMGLVSAADAQLSPQPPTTDTYPYPYRARPQPPTTDTYPYQARPHPLQQTRILTWVALSLLEPQREGQPRTEASSSKSHTGLHRRDFDLRASEDDTPHLEPAQELVRIKNLAALEHAVDPPRVADVRKWIGREQDHVGELAWFERADLVTRRMAMLLPRVAATSACIGVRPARTSNSSSRCSAGPCSVPMLPASEPAAIEIPAACIRRTFCAATAVGAGQSDLKRRGSRLRSSKLAIASGSPSRNSKSLSATRPPSTS